MRMIDRINRGVHFMMRKRIMKCYNKKMDGIARQRPDFFKPVDPETTRKHLELWGRLGVPCNDKWLRFLSNVSGIVDYRYCPDDIFYGVLERILNDCDRGAAPLDDKNKLAYYVPAQYRPKTFVRWMRDAFYDDGYNFVPEERVAAMLKEDHGPLIGKICIVSLGGHGVTAWNFEKGRYVSSRGETLTVELIKKMAQSYLLQARMEQCAFSASFNPSSANTCRLITLRCPWNGKTVVTAAGMRFGVTDAAIDNMSSGGMCVALSNTGRLARVAATNWYKGDPVVKHPRSGIVFGEQTHPYYGKMCEVVCSLAARIPYMNMLSWDAMADKDGNVIILEVNPVSQGIDWPQFDFGPLFGDQTEELVDWCAAHRDLDAFKHFRTWY